MNIGFFSETYSPDINGVITSMNMFREELEHAGHTVYIFAPGAELFSRPSMFERTPKRKERGVYRFNSFSYPFYKSLRVAIPFNIPVQRQIGKLKLDIVHSHTPFSMGLFAAWVARQERIPHIHTYHTLYPEYVKFYWPGFKKWNQRAVEKLSAVFCNATTEIIAPSDGIHEKLLGYGITKPVTTLPTGINREIFTTKDPGDTIRKRYGIPAKAPLLITVARLGKEKSVDFLLQSFKQVLRHQPDAWYLITGDGPARLDLETLSKELGIAHRVVFTGFMPKRSDVIRAYSTADVFVFASRTDTQCLTLLEAAATGLPLVAVHDKPLETGLHHEVNGFFTDANRAKFAWKVHRLLGDKALARHFGRESVKIARTQSAEKRVKELLVIYERAVRERSVAVGGRSAGYGRLPKVVTKNVAKKTSRRAAFRKSIGPALRRVGR